MNREVMAIFSRAGCNSGACHGNLNGKGGFKLSLRGHDAEFDHQWVVRESGGRRVNLVTPEDSLLLLKATGRVSHQGGTRFTNESPEYRLLRDWIATGAPGPIASEPPLAELLVEPAEKIVIGEAERQIPLRATAIFADGERRDVIGLAAFEPSNLTVRVDPAGTVQRLEFGEATVVVRYLQKQVAVSLAFVPEPLHGGWQAPEENSRLDRYLFERLRTLHLPPAPLADDSTFLRRVFLDTLGVLPTAEEARDFVADTRPDKRERLVDALLARPEFADLWALRWSDILRNEEKVLDPRGVAVFHQWIRQSMAASKPLDQFVRELLRATGSTYENPPANFWRANREVETRAETVARLFLGVRLQCARCHNHPFDQWTQDDYYAWSAIFARIDYDILKNERQDKLDKNEFNGEQVVKIADFGGVPHPRTGHFTAAKLLGGPPLSPGNYQDRLLPLAVWMTSPENQPFTRTLANFVWYHFMGRGLVEPIDDLRPTNPAANEQVLQELARILTESQFDLRTLSREILLSRAYQLSSFSSPGTREDSTQFSRATVVRLPAEKLLDAISQVLDSPADFAGVPAGQRAGELPGVRKGGRKDGLAGGDRFLRTFGKPERLLACECERSNETSLSQAFVLLSGGELQRQLASAGNRLDRWSKSTLSETALVEELYWLALARPPHTEELEAALKLFQPATASSDPTTTRFTALQDLAWALLNSKEFVFRW